MRTRNVLLGVSIAATLAACVASTGVPHLSRLYRSGNFPTAATECQQIYPELPSYPYRDQIRYYYFCGNTYFGMGQYPQAMQFLTTALAMRQNLPDAIPRWWNPTIEEQIARMQAMGVQPAAPAGAPTQPR